MIELVIYAPLAGVFFGVGHTLADIGLRWMIWRILKPQHTWKTTL